MNWLALIIVFAGSFWESKAPADWTQEEIAALFTESPWAHPLIGPQSAPGVSAYLATAKPMEQAEKERERRMKKKPASDPLAEEYRVWLEDNRETQVVLAIRVSDAKAYADNKEIRQMEEESVMKAGRKKVKMTGHFPPSAADPYLRLAFPRDAVGSAKTLTFELYIPGIAIPFRTVEFILRDMVVNGKVEM